MQILEWFLTPLTSYPIGLSRNLELSTNPATGTHQWLVSLSGPLVCKWKVNATFIWPMNTHVTPNPLHSQILKVRYMMAYNLPSVLHLLW